MLATWLTLLPLVASAQSDFWVQGNGPEGGQVEAMYRHSNGDLFLSMRWSQRIYRSTDNGLTWASIDTDIPDAVNTFAGDAEGNIYVAVSCWQPCGSKNGVWMSSDDGETWTYLGLGTNEVVAVFADGAGNLFAGAYTDSGGRLYRSTNGGLNWSSVLSTQDPVTGFATGSDGRIIATAEVSGLRRSADGGMTWTNVGFPCNANCSSNWPNKAVVSRLLNEAGGGTVYAYSPWQGVFTSTNNGTTWSPLNDGLPADSETGAFDWDISSDGDIVLALTGGRVFRLENGATTWAEIGDASFASEYFIDSVVYGSDGAILVTPGQRGPFRTEDVGETWTASRSGIVDATVGRMFVGSDGTIYVPSGGGAAVTRDLAESWEYVDFPSDLTGGFLGGGLLGLGPSGEFFAGRNMLARSSDGGATWETISTPWQQTENVSNEHVAVAASGHLLVSVFDNFPPDGNLSGLYRSTDDGDSWNRAAVGSGDVEVRFLEIAADGKMYVGTGGWPEQAIYVSSDNGATWAKIWSVQEREVRRMAVADDGTLFVASDLGIQRSDDGGATWTTKNAGLPRTSWANVPIAGSLLATPEGELYLGIFDRGVWVSQDKGDSWTSASTGLGDVSLTHIESMALARGYLMAGSSSSGLFRSMDRVIAVDIADDGRGHLPNRFTLEQNYPNPFNPQTTIRFDLPGSSDVRLTVTDLTGRVVWTEALGNRQAGTHQVAFDASGLSSGVYLYRVEAGGASETRRMVLMK